MLSVTIPRGLIIVPVSLDTLEMEFPVAQVTTCFCSLLFTYMIEVFARINFVIDIQSFIGRRNGFAQICSLQIYPKFVKTEEQIWGKDGKCHIYLVIYIPVFWYPNVAFTIFTPLFLQTCNILAGANFQIHFFVQCLKIKLFSHILRYLCQPCGGPCALVL